MGMIGILKATQVDTLPPRKTPYADGGNLYLDIRSRDTRYWAFIFRWQGETQYFSFGPAGRHGLGLADARDKAAEGRALLAGKPKIDPRTVWKPVIKPDVDTFIEATDRWFAMHEPTWKNPRYAKHWRKVIDVYCQPLHDVPVDQITQMMVLEVLEPIWHRILPTAERLRAWIEAIINYGRDAEDDRPNPARWERGLDRKLPEPKKLIRMRQRHYPALAYEEAPAFSAALRARPGIVARALEFTILNASRTSEVRLAKWDEVEPRRVCRRLFRLSHAAMAGCFVMA